MNKFTLLMLCLGLTACSYTTKQTDVVRADQHIEKQLVRTAEQVESALRQLAETQYKPPAPALSTEALITEANLSTPISLDWSGPIEPLLQKIATLGQYTVKVLGPAPAIPILVSVHATTTPMADVIKDASLQLGQRADVVVYPKDKLIELRYHTI